MALQDTIVLDGELSLELTGSAEVGVFTALREILPIYTGAVEVTPSAETQTLRTEQKSLMSDIVINPIPSNYGLVTWNGSYLMIS